MLPCRIVRAAGQELRARMCQMLKSVAALLSLSLSLPSVLVLCRVHAYRFEFRERHQECCSRGLQTWRRPPGSRRLGSRLRTVWIPTLATRGGARHWDVSLRELRKRDPSRSCARSDLLVLTADGARSRSRGVEQGKVASTSGGQRTCLLARRRARAAPPPYRQVRICQSMCRCRCMCASSYADEHVVMSACVCMNSG